MLKLDRAMTTALVALGVLCMSGTAHAHGHRHRGYDHTPAICSQLPIDPGMSQALGPLSIQRVDCHVRMSHGYPIPDPRCTPGAINPTVSLDVLNAPGFRTRCIRNRVTTEREKAVTYRWYALAHPRHNRGHSQICELDHLVPLELGGADTLDNIWPECGPADGPFWKRDFKRKDLVENYLAKRVRDGKLSLWQAQQDIARDWTTYLQQAIRDCPFGQCR